MKHTPKHPEGLDPKPHSKTRFRILEAILIVMIVGLLLFQVFISF
ncbi:hypothetical protein [Marinoscillum furvescens]|nr:hypothetical protein [Marinoscillum furvescens]